MNSLSCLQAPLSLWLSFSRRKEADTLSKELIHRKVNIQVSKALHVTDLSNFSNYHHYSINEKCVHFISSYTCTSCSHFLKWFYFPSPVPVSPTRSSKTVLLCTLHFLGSFTVLEPLSIPNGEKMGNNFSISINTSEKAILEYQIAPRSTDHFSIK